MSNIITDMMELHLETLNSSLLQKHEIAVGFGYIKDVHGIVVNISNISMTRVI